MSVVAVNPFRLNQRLCAQQGVFLCPTDIESSFKENLLPDGKLPLKDEVVRIVIAPRLKTKAVPD